MAMGMVVVGLEGLEMGRVRVSRSIGRGAKLRALYRGLVTR